MEDLLKSPVVLVLIGMFVEHYLKLVGKFLPGTAGTPTVAEAKAKAADAIRDSVKVVTP